MRKAFLVWRHTYRRSVLHPAFLLFTFGLPIAYAVAAGIAAYFINKAGEGDARPIGYVDMSGQLISADAWQPADPTTRTVNMLAYDDEAEAEDALKAGTIQAYYVVAPDYVASGYVTEVSVGDVKTRVRAQVRSFLRESLLRETPPDRRARIADGGYVFHRSLNDQREMTFQIALQWGVAAAVLVAFYFINISSTSDMLHALNEEVWGNTIEITLTSLTVEQLLAGKVAGVVSAGLTQFTAWALGAGAPTFAVLQLLALGGIELSFAPLWGTLALCLVLLFPAYVMNAAGIVIINAVTDLAGRGEQLASLLLSLGSIITGPLALIAISAPDNRLAVALSIIPFTSPMIMVVRFVQVAVPAWQITLAIALVWGATILSIPVAARMYRATWLMAGQKSWARSLWLAITDR